jgi:DNA-binding Lrp family transcriptional regulator
MRRPALLELDRVDRALLRMLQRDGRTPISRLASEVSLSETPCWRRVKRLEEAGYIQSYKARVDRRKAGYDLVVFVLVAVDKHTSDLTREFEQRILACPRVLAFHNVSGAHDFLLQVVARNSDDYSRFVEGELRAFPFISDILSVFSLRDIGGEIDLPI